jgi:hypothetical protein
MPVMDASQCRAVVCRTCDVQTEQSSQSVMRYAVSVVVELCVSSCVFGHHSSET